jgi:hypothetical protein
MNHRISEEILRRRYPAYEILPLNRIDKSTLTLKPGLSSVQKRISKVLKSRSNMQPICQVYEPHLLCRNNEIKKYHIRHHLNVTAEVEVKCKQEVVT